jgi:hypothetical protein
VGVARPWLTAGVAALTALGAMLVVPWASGDEPTEPEIEGFRSVGTGDLSIRVGFGDRADGALKVEMVLQGLPERNDFYFKRMGRSPEHEFSDVAFEDGTGRPIGFEEAGPKFMLEPFEGDTVVARYTAKPGGAGRHGNQGWVAADWASFDGRVYMQPRAAMQLASIQVRFDVPEGWHVATPWRQDGDAWNLDTFRREVGFESLQTACVAMGDFEERRHQVGGTELRIVAHRSFEAEHIERLFTNSTKMADWFHEHVAFDIGAPYLLAWLPKPNEDLGVFGGAWSNAACYEHPVNRHRNWELLGHRFAHPINKYNPTGMEIRDAKDHWFMEGWASYIELVSVAETDIATKKTAFNKLYRKYLEMRSRDPWMDHALADEASVRGEATEFLHYVKGPLAVKMLDTLMQERSGKDMEGFFRHIFGKYGGHRSQIPLRDELEAFSGVSFDDFWANHIDQTGRLLPIWPEYAETLPDVREMEERSAAAFVGDTPLSSHYLWSLGASGEFERYTDIVTFVEKAEARRIELVVRGADPVPDWMGQRRNGLPSVVRQAVARQRLLMQTPFVPAPPTRSLGCGGPPQLPPTRPKFRLVKDHGGAKRFAELLNHEASYDASLGTSGVKAITLRHTKKHEDEPMPARVLGFKHKVRIVMDVAWTRPPSKVDYEILDGDTVLKTKSMTIEPGWHNTWGAFNPDERPEGDRILRLRVRSGDTVLAERRVWQR